MEAGDNIPNASSQRRLLAWTKERYGMEETLISEESKAVVRRFNELFGECWHTGDVDILDEVLAPEFVYHSPGAPPDLGGFKQSLLMLSSGLHDLR